MNTWQARNWPDITNVRFGRLVPLERTYDEHGRGVWWCKCDCGGYVMMNLTEIKRSLSCGCVPFSLVDLRGMKFGQLTVMDHLGKDVWKCQCSCGSPTVAISARRLTAGAITDCGCKTRAARRMVRAVPHIVSTHAEAIRTLHGTLVMQERAHQFALNPVWRDPGDFFTFLADITEEIGPPPPNACQPLRLIQLNPSQAFIGPNNIRWALRGLDD